MVDIDLPKKANHTGEEMSDATKGFLRGLLIAALVIVLWYATSHNIVVFSFPKLI